MRTITPWHNDSDAEPIGLLELYYEVISSLKKNQWPQLHPNAFDKRLFTVAVTDIIKQPMTFTVSETEVDHSNGGHDEDVDNDDDGDGDNIMLLMMIFMMAALLVLMLLEREGRFPEMFEN